MLRLTNSVKVYHPKAVHIITCMSMYSINIIMLSVNDTTKLSKKIIKLCAHVMENTIIVSHTYMYI